MMGLALDELIQSAIEKKSGNKEFALFYSGDGHWSAMVGNPSNSVNLGEVWGEYFGSGSSSFGAVLDLLRKLEAVHG